jgi:hypothetical protein
MQLFYWWADQSSTSGKHYQDLDVDDSWDWAPGVCMNAWIKNSRPLIESVDSLLLLYMKGNDHYNLLTPSLLLPHNRETHGQVGVFLDFESGNLRFFKFLPRVPLYVGTPLAPEISLLGLSFPLSSH